MVGSGVEVTIAMSTGFGTATSEAFTVAPKFVYLPMALELKFETNRSEPSTAIPAKFDGAEISEAFTVAPEVVYSPIVEETAVWSQQTDPIRTRQCSRGCSTLRTARRSPTAPEVVYSPIVPWEVRDKQIRSGHRNASRGA